MARGSPDWAQEGQPIRDQLALVCRILAMEGHSDVTLGHVSIRHPGTDYYWMKCSGLGLEEIGPDDVILLDLSGQKVWGDRPSHSELPIHAEIYRARPDVACVVHTHPPHATALAATDLPLRPVSHEGVLFTDVARFDSTTDLILRPEQGTAVARALGQARALLLRNHGVVVVGRTPEEACVTAIFLEKAARIQILAASLGPYAWTPESEVPDKIQHIYSERQMERYWKYYVRKLQRQETGNR